VVVVKPSVGIPVFIAAVAIASFSVHLALTLNTTWVKSFLNGGTKVVLRRSLRTRLRRRSKGESPRPGPRKRLVFSDL
jgi:hypothetical protein